jgi:hypothetical protein
VKFGTVHLVEFEMRASLPPQLPKTFALMSQSGTGE